MTTALTLRSVKGEPLTHAEVDGNFTALRETVDNAVIEATLLAWLTGERVNVQKYGVTCDGVTDDADAWAVAATYAATGIRLFMPAGTSLVGDQVDIPGDFDLEGQSQFVCRIQKNYYEAGTRAMFQPADLTTDDSPNVRIAKVTLGCPQNVYESVGVRSGKLVNWGLSTGWILEDIIVDHWNGWALCGAGAGGRFRRIHFQNPYDTPGVTNGVDGLHIYGASDPANPHIIEDITGTSYDDLVGLFSITSAEWVTSTAYAVGNQVRVSGTTYNCISAHTSGATFAGDSARWQVWEYDALEDLDIIGVNGRNIHGDSGGARVLAIGLHRSTSAATFAHLYFENVSGKADIASNGNGPIYIYYHPNCTGVMKDIQVNGAVLDGTDCDSYIGIWGPPATTWATATAYAVGDRVFDSDVSYVCITSHTAGATFAGDSAYWTARDITGDMDNIRVSARSERGVTGPSGAGTYGVYLYGHINRLRLDTDINAQNAQYGIRWLESSRSQFFDIRGRVRGGSDHVVEFVTTTNQARLGKVDVEVTNVATNKRAISILGLQDSAVNISATKASGATGTVGIYEGSSSARNTFGRCNLNGIDTPIGLAQRTSNYAETAAARGGAVTQATSRTTGVTCDAMAGAITLVSATGSTSWASFTVTNSFVAAGDTIILSQASGTDQYELQATNVGASSFRITSRTTGGTTSEQPVFNFAIVKG